MNLQDSTDHSGSHTQRHSPNQESPGGQGTSKSQLLLGISLVLIAFNLRPIFSSLSVLLPEIIQQTGLSTSGASYLTTLPVLCLGLFSPVAPRLAQRFTAERTLLGALILLTIGTAVRGIGTVPALALGAILAGAAIAIGNVLLPGVVKRDFSHKTAMMTGFYSMALCVGVASAAAFTIPIKHYLNESWSMALAAWAIPPFIVAILWAPQALRQKKSAQGDKRKIKGLWRDPLAWQVTLFLGLQSALAYSVFGWLAPILRERGLDPINAGLAVSTSVMAQASACLLIPLVLTRLRRQSIVNAALASVSVAALLGLLFSPISLVWFWCVVLGLTQGGLITSALTIIALRSPNAPVAAHLSGMAQGVGYTLAAIGPLFVGLLRSWSGSFDSASILFCILGVGVAVNGWGAGRTLLVKAES